MFNRLRNRFLVLNLVIISIMMLSAFAAIYTITYRNVQNDIVMELRRIADFHDRREGPRELPMPPKEDFQPPAPDGNRGFSPGRSLSFSIVTDAAWNRIRVDSWFAMDEDFYDRAVQAVSPKTKAIGQVGLDGDDWAYVVQPTVEGGHRIVFLDVTARQGILTNLVYTFLFVGLGMLIVIFFISRYFANRSIAPVREAFDKQKRFIADASHELKTPLAVINTNVDVLLSNGDDENADPSKWLRYIKSETERMSKLTGDLLYLTEMEDARESMLFATVNLSDAVEHVVLAMEALIFEKDLTLETDIEPELLVRGNGEQLKQVVMILLDNAMKYANARGRIRVELKRQHHETVFTVENTGEGIAAEHLERIFDRFYRTDPSRSRKHGGYGLGLAIAKSIVEQHKGKIAARSALNETTAFLVTLPNLTERKNMSIIK